VRRAPGLALLGLAALWIQGALATLAPGFVFPDLVFLGVVGVAIAVGGAEGLLVAAVVGYAMDFLTSALLGQHALLLVGAYAATRIASLRLNLLRPIPRAVFVAVLSLAYDVGFAGLGRLFTGVPLDMEWLFVRSLLVHAVLNVLFAPAVIAIVQRASALLAGEDERGRRALRVEPRERVF
jgi:rod shape-determining protein MreD